MKKIYILLLIILLTGCTTNNATSVVFRYLNGYQNITDSIKDEINEIVESENLNEENKQLYKQLFYKQYEDMLFRIDKIKYNGNKATITVFVEVYDFNRVQEEVSEYLANHEEEFNDENGIYDVNKYYKYKFTKMLSVNNRVSYDIYFDLKKENNKWVLKTPNSIDMLKLNGIYAEN